MSLSLLGASAIEKIIKKIRVETELFEIKGIEEIILKIEIERFRIKGIEQIILPS